MNEDDERRFLEWWTTARTRTRERPASAAPRTRQARARLERGRPLGAIVCCAAHRWVEQPAQGRLICERCGLTTPLRIG